MYTCTIYCIAGCPDQPNSSRVCNVCLGARPAVFGIGAPSFSDVTCSSCFDSAVSVRNSRTQFTWLAVLNSGLADPALAVSLNSEFGFCDDAA